MKVNELISSMAFSHRPQDGISIGVAVIANVAYLAVGFVREGDCFNRKLARHILAQRVISTIESDRNVKFVTVIENRPPQVDARAVIRELRKFFKPDHTCNDTVFKYVYSIPGGSINEFGTNSMVEVREPITRTEAYDRIVDMFVNAVKQAELPRVTV